MEQFPVYENIPDMDGNKLRRDLEVDGAVVVRNVLTGDETQELRRIVLGYLSKNGERFSLGKTQPNAAVAVRDLGFIFSHPKILQIFKKIYGDDNVMFTGHCDIHMNMLSGWHKDSGEAFGGYFKGDYLKAGNCLVHKVAIYLQDATDRDGLTVRLGSQHVPDLKAGREVKLQTKAGDIVIFDVRLNHVGQLPDGFEKLLKGCNAFLNGRDRHKQDFAALSWIKNVYWKLVGRRDRLSIFFTYGVLNQFTYDFSYLNIARQKQQTSVSDVELPAELADRLRESRITPFDYARYNSDQTAV